MKHHRPQPEIDLEELVCGNPTLDQVREFWRLGEFHQEDYLVRAIRRHLQTKERAREMAERDVTIEDLLNGRTEEVHEEWVSKIYLEWNQKLGFQAFGG